MTTEIFFFKNHAENETGRLVLDIEFDFEYRLGNGLGDINVNHGSNITIEEPYYATKKNIRSTSC